MFLVILPCSNLRYTALAVAKKIHPPSVQAIGKLVFLAPSFKLTWLVSVVDELGYHKKPRLKLEMYFFSGKIDKHIKSPLLCFCLILPSAIAPSTRMPDSLMTQSGWKSRPLSKGRRWGSNSSRNTLARTSRAAAEHFPEKRKIQDQCWITML